MSNPFTKGVDTPAWCPGCGNFAILKTLEETLAELELEPHEVLICSGIGQAAKTPHYVRVNGFNGLHGRALPVALGSRVANPNLVCIVESGDGDTYGEGGNHFLHNVRRNPNLAHFVHNNQIYGLTKGQASPTSDPGMQTPVQTDGVKSSPLNPLYIALAAGAGFVARGFSGDPDHLKELMKAAITYRGYALLDILQPCVTFNRHNTFAWYRERVRKIDESHDISDLEEARRLAEVWGEEIPIGIFYRSEHRTFEDTLGYDGEGAPAFRDFDPTTREHLQDAFRIRRD
ncbi:MAG: thiamine pyrophosphate-dependent enzyme [Bacillota bacterium]